MTSGVLAFAEKRKYLRNRRDCAADTSGTRDFNARVANISGESRKVRSLEKHEIFDCTHRSYRRVAANQRGLKLAARNLRGFESGQRESASSVDFY